MTAIVQKTLRLIKKFIFTFLNSAWFFPFLLSLVISVLAIKSKLASNEHFVTVENKILNHTDCRGCDLHIVLNETEASVYTRRSLKRNENEDHAILTGGSNVE